MAILKAKKIREMNNKEVQERLKELQLELFKESGSKEIGGTVKNPGQIKEMRRTIARIKTIKLFKKKFDQKQKRKRVKGETLVSP